MKSLYCAVFALASVCSAQNPVPEIRFESIRDFLKFPDDVYMGEGAGVATDSKGNVYVYSRMGGSYLTTGAEPQLVFRSPSGGARLLEFDKNGKFLREIAQPFIGYNLAHSVRIDAQDNIWIVNEGANVIQKFNQSGRLLLSLGRESEVGFERQPGPAKKGVGNGAGEAADMFNRPTDIAWDSAGNIYISDGYGNSRVAKFDKNGVFLKSWGSKGSAPGQFNLPHAIAVDAKDNIYVGDRENSRIQVFDTNGTLKTQFTSVGKPYAICLSTGPHPYLFSSNSNNSQAMENGEIYKVELDGTVVGKFGKAGKQWGEFGTTHGIDCRNPNEVFTAEVSTWRVQKIVLHPAK